MKQTDFDSIGRYLYGNLWKAAISRDLNISESTIRSVCLGRRKMPEYIIKDIFILVANRHFEIVFPILKAIQISHSFVLKTDEIRWSKESDFGIKTELARMLSKKGFTIYIEN